MSPRGWPRLKKTTPEEDTMDEIIARLDEFIRERCDVGDDPDYGLDVNLFDTGFMAAACERSAGSCGKPLGKRPVREALVQNFCLEQRYAGLTTSILYSLRHTFILFRSAVQLP